MNKNTYKYRKFFSTYYDTSKNSKIFRISESMNRKSQNLKSNGVIKDFKELKLLNEMWSHLRGRRNGYILMKNIKTYIAAIMNLWLPCMKARYVYEFENDCNSYTVKPFVQSSLNDRDLLDFDRGPRQHILAF